MKDEEQRDVLVKKNEVFFGGGHQQVDERWTSAYQRSEGTLAEERSWLRPRSALVLKTNRTHFHAHLFMSHYISDICKGAFFFCGCEKEHRIEMRPKKITEM